MYDIVFEKTKGRGGTANRTSVYAEAVVNKKQLKNSTSNKNFAKRITAWKNFVA